MNEKKCKAKRILLFGGAGNIVRRLLLTAAFSATIVFSRKIFLPGNTFATFEEAVFRRFTSFDLTAFLLCFCGVYVICSSACLTVEKYQKAHPLTPRTHSRKVFVLIFMILLLIWLPCLLTYYPGGIYSDTVASVRMATGEYGLSNHHPILYTMLWRAVYTIAGLFSLSDIGTFFLFTCITAVCMSLAVAWFVYSSYVHGVSKIIIILITAFYSLYTLVPLYIVSLWKDTPFAISVLCLCTVLMNVFWDSKSVKEFFKIKYLLPFLIFGLLTAFLRNNGIYVFILLAVVLFLYYMRKSRKIAGKLGIMMLALIAAVFLIRIPLFNRMGWNVEEKVESLGIPMQQVGYIMNTAETMTDRQTAFLNEIMPVEKWKKTYCPLIVDPVKWDSEFNLGFFNTHVKSFLQVYEELVLENPVAAFKGYALATVGFWDPTRQTGTAYVCNFMWNGVPWEMKDIPEERLGFSLKALYNTKIRPSSALYGWLILFFTVIGISTHGRKEIFIPMIPVMGIWLTLLLAVPVAFSLRYFFPAVLVVPMAFVLSLIPGSGKGCE